MLSFLRFTLLTDLQITQIHGSCCRLSRGTMEFMLSEVLPIYSGGLGNVAGDQLKAASDLGVPVIGCSTSKAIFAR